MAETKDVKKDVWAQLKTVYLPRAPRGEEQFLFVSVNDRDFQVPLGKEVKVPHPIYERIRLMQEAQARADAFEREIETSAEPAPFRL